MHWFDRAVILSIFIFSFTSLAWSDMPEIIADQTKEAEVLSSPTVVLDSKTQQANRLESQAIESIDADQMEEGLRLMQQAIEIDPSAVRHMNYGSILFGNGVVDFKNGKKHEAVRLFKQAEDQLSQAIAGFDPQANAAFVAQAYFLLGEIYLNAYNDQDMAHDFYYKSLEYYDNTSARDAIEQLRLVHK